MVAVNNYSSFKRNRANMLATARGKHIGCPLARGRKILRARKIKR